MFFRNLKVFRLTGLLLGLEERLPRGAWRPCAPNQPTSRGWIAPRKNDGSLLYQQGNSQLLAYRAENRFLPTGVVAQEVELRAADLEFSQGHKPGRAQLRELRERVIEELLPRAFPRSRVTYVWINQAAGWLAINTPSDAVADDILIHLRGTLEEFPVSRIDTVLAPSAAMAEWLLGEDPPSGFTLDDSLQIEGRGFLKAKITYQHQPVDCTAEVQQQIANGLLPTKMAMTWDDRLSFTVTETMHIKQLSFLDLLKNQAPEQVEDQFASDFALMSGELLRFLPALVEAFGDEVPKQ